MFSEELDHGILVTFSIHVVKGSGVRAFQRQEVLGFRSLLEEGNTLLLKENWSFASNEQLLAASQDGHGL